MDRLLGQKWWLTASLSFHQTSQCLQFETEVWRSIKNANGGVGIKAWYKLGDSRTVRAEAAATRRESLQFLIREKFG